MTGGVITGAGIVATVGVGAGGGVDGAGVGAGGGGGGGGGGSPSPGAAYTARFPIMQERSETVAATETNFRRTFTQWSSS